MDKTPPKSRLKGVIQLVVSLFCIWLFIWHISPIIERTFPAFAQYKKVAIENELTPSALYYNDVHITQDAAQDIRSTWLFYQSAKEKSKEVKSEENTSQETKPQESNESKTD